MGEVNKLFGRNFLIGFFLPALIFLVALSFSLSAVGIQTSWLAINPQEPLKETAVMVALSFVFAVLLQSINRELFRALEGYWPKRLRECFSGYQRLSFQKLQKQISKLRAERERHRKESPEQPFPDRQELNRLSEEASNKFPSKEYLVLPTTFGNVVRAYEDYPRVMYGFESISGWARIQLLLSKQAAESLGESRARVDMWLNLYFLAWLGLFLNFALMMHFEEPLLFLAVLSCIFVFWISYWRVTRSAERYGQTVKAVYDLHLGDLCRKLGFEPSQNWQENKKFWEVFSQAIVYRNAESLSKLESSGLKKPQKTAPKEPKADTGDEEDE